MNESGTSFKLITHRVSLHILKYNTTTVARGTKVDASYYFGEGRSKGFATLRNVSKLPFFDKNGQAKSVGFYSVLFGYLTK